MLNVMGEDIRQSQMDYYQARADEYDDFWFRRRGYALEEPLAGQWLADAESTLAYVRENVKGEVLELAGGTGIFTEQLNAVAESVHVLDGSPRMLELNADRLGGVDSVTYEQADLFAWRPGCQYDTVFFSFWLSHVPDEDFTAFWEMARSCLNPNGRVVFIDSRALPGSESSDVRVETRSVTDGREFEVYKRYWEPTDLMAELNRLRWVADVGTSPNGLMTRGRARPVG